MMITEHEEIARYRVAEQIQAAEAYARRKECQQNKTPRTNGPRHGIATAVRHLADRLEPASRRLAEPQPHHRGTGLSVVR